ncbi:MAG: lactate racemase domain-containing protein [Promethearchaeota archaeon]
MAKIVRIPWAAWYGDIEYELEFPDSWEVEILKMADAPEINVDDIKKAIDNPINSPDLESLAKGKKNAVIAVEDISRPSYLGDILKIIINKLNNAGIKTENITLIYALGSHRPMNRFDSIKKIGKELIDLLNVENHHPYENLTYIGDSKKGTPIHINTTYYEADLKISVGSVLSHPLAGFGGGAKTILPGMCGIETLAANHQAGVRGIGIGLGIVTELRKDIEDVCKIAGLDFSVNIIPNLKRKIAAVYAGDFIEAHRKAMEKNREVYGTEIPPKLKLDACFFNLYPEDTELSQSVKGFNFFLASKRFIKRNGAIVIMTAASEGRGYHSLQGETGAKLYQNWGDSIIFKAVIKNNTFGLFSPNVNKFDVLHFYPPQTIFSRTFGDIIKKLEGTLGSNLRVGVIPCSNQLPK